MDEQKSTVVIKRLLIVGGTGFIGSHLCQKALEQRYAVTVISLREPTKKSSEIEYLTVDLNDLDAMQHLLRERSFEYVVNCSGYIDHSHYSSGGQVSIYSHFDAIRNLLECLDQKCLIRFVQIGSSDEYGNACAPQQEIFREAPISPYSFAKVASTHFLQMLWRTEQFPAVILRLFLVYGPGQNEKRFVPQIIQGCMNENYFPVSLGSQLRDLCYVEDIVEGILHTLHANNVCGEIINLASGFPISIRAVIEKIQNLMGSGNPQFGQLPFRIGENMALYADVLKAKQLLNWHPKMTLQVGLERTIAYYRTLLYA